jgi:hypothetical protein
LRAKLLSFDHCLEGGAKPRLVIPRQVASSWTALGKFLLDMGDESGPVKFQMPIEVEVEPEEVGMVVESDNNARQVAVEETQKGVIEVGGEEEKRCEETVTALVAVPKSGLNKRKNASSNSEDYWKRRSSRKFVDLGQKEAETELKISDILAKFFDEDYLK